MLTLHATVAAGAPGAALTVPVDPDAETARGWAEAELAQPIYHERPNLLTIGIEWLLEQLEELLRAAGAFDPAVGALVVTGLVVLGVGIALLVAGPVRRARGTGRDSVAVFGDDIRTAAELLAAADAHAAAGRWGEAVLDRFRAVLRSLEDRALLDERPGRTAHEATEEAGTRLPTCAEDLRRAGRLFDDVCYGDAAATADDDAWLRGLAERVAAARPQRVDEPFPVMAVPR